MQTHKIKGRNIVFYALALLTVFALFLPACKIQTGNQQESFKKAIQYNQNGVNLIAENRYRDAIEEFNKAIALNPDFALAYSNRAFAHMNTGELDKAIADCTRAIKLDTTLASAYNNRGYSYALKGEFDKAIADCTRAIELKPADAAAYDSRGYAYKGKGEFEKAIADFTKAIEMGKDDPNVAEAYLNRGLVFKEMNKKTEAISDIKKCLEVSHNKSLSQRAQKILDELQNTK